MKHLSNSVELPLRFHTPDAWGDSALADPVALLCDHAHLEKKAAANALELLTRWPESNPPENWAAAMTAIARDEVEHLAIVTKLLYRRGGQLDKHHANPYAAALRNLVRSGGRDELVDRLLVSSLIELRSCERFEILSRSATDGELQKLYKSLWSSEHGHYLVFLRLAEEVCLKDEVADRWQAMLAAEAEIIRNQPAGSRMHSGV